MGAAFCVLRYNLLELMLDSTCGSFTAVGQALSNGHRATGAVYTCADAVGSTTSSLGRYDGYITINGDGSAATCTASTDTSTTIATSATIGCYRAALDGDVVAATCLATTDTSTTICTRGAASGCYRTA